MLLTNGFPAIDRQRTGRRIRMCMENKGLTVEDVRAYLHLGSVQSIYHWLEGISIPSVDNLYALSVLLEVPVDRLLCGNYDICSGSPEQRSKKRIEFYMDELRARAA